VSEKLPLIKPAAHPSNAFKLGKDSILLYNSGSYLLLSNGLKDLRAIQQIKVADKKMKSFVKWKNELFLEQMMVFSIE